MSPATAVTDPAGSLPASRSSICRLLSTPVTASPCAASGTARRPVPTPSSSTRPPAPASATTVRTVAPTSLDVAVPVVVHVGEGVAVGGSVVAAHDRIIDQTVPVADIRAGTAATVAFSAMSSHPTVPAGEVVYLDHAATTPMRREAIEAMLPYLDQRLRQPQRRRTASPGDARQALDEARDVVADVLGCDAGRGRVHRRRHRGRQHGDLGRSCARAGAAAVLGGRAPRRAACGRARRRSHRRRRCARAGSTSTSSPTRSSERLAPVRRRASCR